MEWRVLSIIHNNIYQSSNNFDYLSETEPKKKKKREGNLWGKSGYVFSTKVILMYEETCAGKCMKGLFI